MKQKLFRPINLGLVLVLVLLSLFSHVGFSHGTTTVGLNVTTDGKVTANALNLASSTNSSLTSGDLWNSSGTLNFYDGSATQTLPFLAGALSGSSTAP